MTLAQRGTEIRDTPDCAGTTRPLMSLQHLLDHVSVARRPGVDFDV